MREIKFRAWVKEVRDGDVILPGFMDYDPVWQDIKVVRMEQRDAVGSPMIDMFKQHVAKVNDIFGVDHGLMQFTGLYDKSGKEIYEGDILKGSGDWTRPAVVEWDGGGFHGTGGYKHMGWSFFQNMEVIGNVYENPELLKR